MSSRLGFDVQAAAGDYKEEHVLTTRDPPNHGFSHAVRAPVIFRGVCVLNPSLLLSHSGAGLGYG